MSEYIMNYLRIYNDLCSNRKEMEEERLILKESGEYFERHHIKPKCANGDNSKNNLVLLTAREHFIAHYLLYRVILSSPPINTKIKRDLICAFLFMGGQNSTTHKRYNNSYMYESAKRIWASFMRSDENPHKGKPRSESHKRKTSANHAKHWLGKPMSDKTKDKISKALTGIKRSDETKKLMSISQTGHIVTEITRQKLSDYGKANPINYWLGKTRSDEDKKKMSDAAKGRIPWNKGIPSSKDSVLKMIDSLKKVKKLTCPHCNREFRPATAKRWHFDNCKLNPNRLK